MNDSPFNKIKNTTSKIDKLVDKYLNKLVKKAKKRIYIAGNISEEDLNSYIKQDILMECNGSICDLKEDYIEAFDNMVAFSGEDVEFYIEKLKYLSEMKLSGLLKKTFKDIEYLAELKDTFEDNLSREGITPEGGDCFFLEIEGDRKQFEETFAMWKKVVDDVAIEHYLDNRDVTEAVKGLNKKSKSFAKTAVLFYYNYRYESKKYISEWFRYSELAYNKNNSDPVVNYIYLDALVSNFHYEDAFELADKFLKELKDDDEFYYENFGEEIRFDKADVYGLKASTILNSPGIKRKFRNANKVIKKLITKGYTINPNSNEIFCAYILSPFAMDIYPVNLEDTLAKQLMRKLSGINERSFYADKYIANHLKLREMIDTDRYVASDLLLNFCAFHKKVEKTLHLVYFNLSELVRHTGEDVKEYHAFIKQIKSGDFALAVADYINGDNSKILNILNTLAGSKKRWKI